MRQKPVTYLALDVGRGHLMMAGTVAKLLAEQGLTCQAFTPSDAGRRFYRSFTGDDARLLSPWFRFAWRNYDLCVKLSIVMVLHYFVNPAGLAADLWRLRQPLSRAGLILNDIHPVGLLLPLLPSRIRDTPVVHILSEHSWEALKEIIRPRWWPDVRDILGELVDRIALSGRHLIVNTLDPSKFFTTVGKITYLPPLLSSEKIAVLALRQDLGLPSRKRLFVAYLNPLFRDPCLIQTIIEASREYGAYLYLVSEYAASHVPHAASRDVTVVAYDFHLLQHLLEAELYISGAGLAAPLQAYVAGVPFLGLVSRQPEHVKNALTIEQSGIGHCIPTSGNIHEAMGGALALRSTPHPHLVEAVQERWLEIIQSNRLP